MANSSMTKVFAASRNATQDEGLIRQHVSSDGRLSLIDMDVSSEESVSAAVNRIRQETPRVVLVINSAGLLHNDSGVRPERRLDDISASSLERSFAVNAIGPLLVAKHCQALLDRQERVVFASLSARLGSIGDNRLGGWYGYRASKAAQNMVTKNLSIELRRRSRGVICVALHPGTVDTALSQPFQRGVRKEHLFAPEHAAGYLLNVIEGLRPIDNGGFFGWDGQPIPW